MKCNPRTILNKKSAFSFMPDFISINVEKIDFAYLRSLGIKACFIDLDGTVVDRGTYEVHPQITGALTRCGLKIFIATNRPKSRSLKDLKSHLHADGVIHPKGIKGKPTTAYFDNGLHETGFQKHEVVMIGDRLLQDIGGANRAGIYSLAVFKLGTHKGFIDKIISKIERNFLQKHYDRYIDCAK